MTNNQILGPSKGYTDLLDDATLSIIKKEAGRLFKSPIRPSNSGACTRELYFSLMEFHGKANYDKKLITPETHRLFSLGHSIEWNLIQQLRNISDIVDIRYKQQVLSFKYFDVPADPKMSQWLEGSLDLVLWSDKYKCVADVKSKKDGFDKRAQRGRWDLLDMKFDDMESVEQISDTAYWVDDLSTFLDELEDPFFAANFLQLNLYANSQFLKERGIDHGAILQYNKNDSRLREVRFRPSETLYQKVLTKFQTALDAAAAGDVNQAPRDHERDSFKCRYCPYSSACWSDGPAKKWGKRK